ncbi:MAG: hypothetical protein ACYDH9_14120 [Limisphaerales bacterium]
MTMTTQSITSSITEGQKKQYLRFVEDAAERALGQVALDKDGIQKLAENGDEFQARIIAWIKELSVSNQFASEEVASSYSYPNGYKVKGITEQTNILRQLFLGVGFADEKIAEQPLPAGAEGWFAIPKWQTMAATYNEALEKVLAMIASKRKFYNYREGALGTDRLRQHARMAKMFEALAEQQKDHDILVVPAQFGLRHRGRSVRRAREVFTSNECGLGAFAIGIVLLTHPERQIQWEQFHVDCAGDEYSPGADGRFGRAPLFGFDGGVVRFGTGWFGSASDCFGSASAFLAQ